MSAGIETSWELLASTENEAASEVLIPALDSSWRSIRDTALATLLTRRSYDGQMAVLRRLHDIDDAWRAMLFEHRESLSKALRDTMLDPDSQVCSNGCEALIWLREYELMPALVNAVEDAANVNAAIHAGAMLQLADALQEELSLPRDFRQRRDPQRVRGACLNRLEPAVLNFSRHNSREIMESFLVLATRENPTLKALLANPHHSSYLPVIDLMMHSERPGVVRLVLSALDDPHPASVSLSMLTRRQSPKFISQLLRKFGPDPGPVVLANTKKIENLPWIHPDRGVIQKLEDDEQGFMIKMAVASGQKRSDVLQTVEYMIYNGKPAGRRAAAESLSAFASTRVERLGQAALDDTDPHVQAAAVRYIGAYGGPNHLSRLIGMAESTHGAVRNAVRETLTAFRFPKYLASFDGMDEDARRSTGMVVRKIDSQTIPLLSAEFYSPVRTRRLRAFAVAKALDVITAVESHLRAALADDKDHVVRTEAANALAACPTPSAAAALLEAKTSDTSVPVREAAEHSFRELEAQGVKVQLGPPETEENDV